MYTINKEMVELAIDNFVEFNRQVKNKFGENCYIIYGKVGEYLLKNQDIDNAHKNLDSAIAILKSKKNRNFIDELNLILLYEKANLFNEAIMRSEKMIKNFNPSNNMYEIMNGIIHRCKMKFHFKCAYNEYLSSLKAFENSSSCDNPYLKRKSEESVHELNKMISDMNLIRWK